MAVPKQKSVPPPQRRVLLTTKADEEDMLDWDARIETYPPRPTRLVKCRFVRQPKQPPNLSIDMEG